MKRSNYIKQLCEVKFEHLGIIAFPKALKLISMFIELNYYILGNLIALVSQYIETSFPWADLAARNEL